jgi:hypothetical protein
LAAADAGIAMGTGVRQSAGITLQRRSDGHRARASWPAPPA